jgi:thioredoxin
LVAGRPVDAAVAEARKAMYTVSPIEWATPVLYLRADDALLFDISQHRQPARVAQGDLVIEVSESTFNTDVVVASQSVPVIMDLWAEWCEPCQQLSPVLRKLAEEANGQWILARVDVDANPKLSAALQVQSLPMVLAILSGQVIDGFLGPMPEASVRTWLTQIMEAAGPLGLRQ